MSPESSKRAGAAGHSLGKLILPGNRAPGNWDNGNHEVCSPPPPLGVCHELARKASHGHSKRWETPGGTLSGWLLTKNLEMREMDGSNQWFLTFLSHKVIWEFDSSHPHPNLHRHTISHIFQGFSQNTLEFICGPSAQNRKPLEGKDWACSLMCVQCLPEVSKMKEVSVNVES